MEKKIVVDAKIENLYPLLDAINQELKEAQCEQDIIYNVNICVEEVFVNIASYSYGEQEGQVEVDINTDSGEIEILFKDSGTPYNPLMKEDPDTSLSADERQIGGLGIFMVKEMMDSVDYEYRDNKNCLRIKKKLKIKEN